MFLPRHLQRIWDGSPIDGQRVLIRCYHGLGDTLQFVRFVPDVMKRAASVCLWAQPKLLDLLRTLRPAPTLMPLHDGIPDVAYDVDLELMEVPSALGLSMLAPPRDLPYFHVGHTQLDEDPGGVHYELRTTNYERMCGRSVHTGLPLRVGLAWRAGDWDDRRSLATSDLAPLFTVPGIQWVIAQPDACADECLSLPACRPDIGPVIEHARLLRTLDLLITIDSMPAHLAGALAVRTCLLLHSDPDWRWRSDEAGIAYPTIRTFRQSMSGDWRPVIESVRDELLRRSQDRDERG